MASEQDEIESDRKRLSGVPLDTFLNLVATEVKDELVDSIPELTLKSRPKDAVLNDFEAMKLGAVSNASPYETKIDYIRTFLLDDQNLETTEALTSEIVERYDDWRKYESLDRDEPLSDVTLQDDMYLFREFIHYLIEHRLAPVRYYHLIDIPETNPEKGEGIDEKKLDPEVAKAAREYLRKYQFADVEHIAMELFLESGPRKSGVWSADLEDFQKDGEDWILRMKHRDATGLKNNLSSNRDITLYDETPTILQDYLEDRRPDVTDEHGREPLLTKGDGRIGKSTLKKIAYKWTRPCQIGLGCPHDRDPEDCTAAQKDNFAYECPSSRAPHHIRKGYITDQRNAGVSPEAVEQRCDVTPEVQKRHYDLPDSSEDRQRYDDEFRDADSDENSGFAH